MMNADMILLLIPSKEGPSGCQHLFCVRTALPERAQAGDDARASRPLAEVFRNAGFHELLISLDQRGFVVEPI